MLNVIFIVGVIALRHLPTLLNVDVDVEKYSRKSRWFTNHTQGNAYFTDHEKSKTIFPRTVKYRFTNHGKIKASFTLHAKQKCSFTRHEKSIGDPLRYGVKKYCQ